MQHVCAVAPAKMGGCVGNCYKDRVTPDFVPDKEAIAIGTAVGRGAEVHVQGVVKLIREARVSRYTTFPQLAGLATRHLHDHGLIDFRANRFAATRLHEYCDAERKKSE